MKALLAAISLLFGVGIGLALAPPVEVVEAAEYLAVPRVEASCEVWVVQETGPDHYWDTNRYDQSKSTADYWAVETLGADGGIDRSELAPRGETISVAPGAYPSVTVVWLDSDRVWDPEPLKRIAALVPDC